MLLSTSTMLLEVLLGGAHTTNPLDCVTHYEDTANENLIPQVQIAQTNGATPVTLLAAPGDNVARRVKEITIENNDTVTQIVTVRLKSDADTRKCIRMSLLTGQTLQWTPESGWFVPGQLTSTLAGLYAPLNSPAFTGVPTAPTAAKNVFTTQIATTEYVRSHRYGIFTALLTSSQSPITSGSWSQVNLNTVLVDTEAAWSAANFWYVVPRTGLWRIGGKLSGATTGTFTGGSVFSAIISKNFIVGAGGATTADYLTEGDSTVPGAINSEMVVLPTNILSLTAGDKILLNGNATGSGTIRWESAPSPRLFTGMTVEWVGDT